VATAVIYVEAESVMVNVNMYQPHVEFGAPEKYKKNPGWNYSLELVLV